MNSLNLRISGGERKKTKNTFNFATVIMPDKYSLRFGTNEEIGNFAAATSVDKQLTVLKNILNSVTRSLDEDTLMFLVIVFLQAEVKHPVKCLVTRYVTKSDRLSEPFGAALSKEIAGCILDEPNDYKGHADLVGKVASCIENFPAGAAAVKKIEIELANYLKNGLTFVVKTLRDTTSSSPAEKNEIFTLAHSMLRLILYVLQKISADNVDKVTPMFADIRSSLKYLLLGEEVPMDTTSVCGIVYVSMRTSENGPDSWVNILDATEKDPMLKSFLENDVSELSLYSAVATAVPAHKLQAQIVDGVPAVLTLTANVIAIGERTSSDSTFNLSITRTLVQISKGLDRTTDTALGLRLADVLLMYVWSHLEHYMDSVRHLSAQALANVVGYCARLHREGDSSSLDNLFAALNTLDRNRKSFYVSLTALTAELGAASVTARLPGLVRQVLDKLQVQAVQASATTALETLLQKHMSQASTEATYECWVVPVLDHVARRQLDNAELAILESLLTKVIKLDENVMNYIVPLIKQTCEESGKRYDLKCVLMLLSVARRSGAAGRPAAAHAGPRWRGAIRYDALRRAAVHSHEQTRILSLSLIAESPKSTEMFTPEELDFVLYFLKYNVNAQAPNFRQLVLSSVKKLIRRVEDSHKTMRRESELRDTNEGDYYVCFLEELRSQCFDELLAGASYGRRYVALQVLVWCENIHIDGLERKWNECYVEKLLLHLEDSYENNKAFALDVLKRCPVELLKGKNYSTSLDITDILQQASSVKPTDCVSAAYKLNLLRARLPEHILRGQHCTLPEPVDYILLRSLLEELHKQLSICRISVVFAARDAPMYGVLHCIARVMDTLCAEAIAEDDTWSSLIAEMVSASIAANEAVAGVVNSASPEGHLPMDLGGVAVGDHGNSDNVRLADGRPVTAQMVLLCAWRSVKEVSLLLGCICSRLTISEAGPGSVSRRQLLAVGEHFTTLLANTKHRGAFEQAYVGFSAFLARLWRCRTPELHELPKTWLNELMEAIVDPDGRTQLCTTRRSAGIPYMIQALVSAETAACGSGARLAAVAATLERARGAPARYALRAVLRAAALQRAAAPRAPHALRAALAGFDGDTWEERNSSTLLFSALMVRIFGVQRSRDGDRLCTRNKMTGRIFFLRYPQLYDYILNKLEEASRSRDAHVLRPSLYPILLLLARLYPSSLEGTVSNLKLVSFVPHVLSCSRSAVLRTRQLAARAMLPLVSPEQYVSHLESMLEILCDMNIQRNYCHGILLQIIRLLDNKPDGLIVDEQSENSLKNKLDRSLWVLRQAAAAAAAPCYLIADEYLKMINLLLWRFQQLLRPDTIGVIIGNIDILLFGGHEPRITGGRDACAASAAYLYFIISNIYGNVHPTESLYKCLAHESYEVVLSALNYILIMYQEIDTEDKLRVHLSEVASADILRELKVDRFYDALCRIVRTNKYLECNRKALKILTLDEDTQPYVIRSKRGEVSEATEEMILQKLIFYIENEHESLTHIYLLSLANFLTKLLKNKSMKGYDILEAVRVMLACSSADNGGSTRRVVVDFLDKNVELLLALDLNDSPDEDKFEYKATIYSTLVTLLEDDDVTLSQTTSDFISRAAKSTSDVIPSKCAEALRDYMKHDEDAGALFVVLALLDFKCEVAMTDEGNDECRVFDQNERYNVYLEETVWTTACADMIRDLERGQNGNLLDYVLDLVDRPKYKETLEKLCGDNLAVFKNMSLKVSGSSPAENPKMKLFFDALSR